MSLDEMVLAHTEQLVIHGVQISRINAALGIAGSAAEVKECPGCRKPVAPNADGSLPPHQIDGAVLGTGRRRTVSVCRWRPETASSVVHGAQGGEVR